MSKTKSSDSIVVGQCADCGGDTVIPTVWFGVCEPTPSCAACGASTATAEADVIELSDDSLDAVLCGPSVSVKLW